MTEPLHPPRHAREHDGTFRILVVCTGNICRSPLTEQLLRARLRDAFPEHDPNRIEVSSAGTMALEGHAMEPLAVDEARRLGIPDAEEHVARHLTRALVERADLVVAMTREHRSATVRALPRAHHRAFTLIELTRTLEAVAAGRSPVALEPLGDGELDAFLRGAVEAAEVRGLQPLHERKHLDIPDPYRRAPAVYRRAADAVADHVDRLVVALQSLAVGRELVAAGEQSPARI